MSFTGLFLSAAQARGMPATEQASVMARAL
jgi:hypothetical protein